MKPTAYCLTFCVFLLHGLNSMAQVNGMAGNLRSSDTNSESAQSANAHLSPLYANSACGLNFKQATVKVGRKQNVNGLHQPAPLVISGIPSCAIIDKAFLWAVETGNGAPIAATFSDPANVSSNFPMTIAGSGPDICWARPGTYTYRADVTSMITGNGTYRISGLPLDSISTTGNDVDGATLMIIYEDHSMSYTGNIFMNDGCVAVQGGAVSDTVFRLSACTGSVYASGFMVLADVYGPGSSYQFSGIGPVSFSGGDFMNFISAPVTVNHSQSSFVCSFQTNGDCYALAADGLYFQTNCSACNPVPACLTLTGSSTPDTCYHNGTATVGVSGGTGNYTYSWNSVPAQFTATAVNLPSGTYQVFVSDGSLTASAWVTVGYSGMSLHTTNTAATCLGGGMASVNVSAGHPPYTYSWSSVPVQTTFSATNLPAGNYTVQVTDHLGCSATDTVTVKLNTAILAFTHTNQICATNGTSQITITGGAPPFTYSWSTSPSQTTPIATNLSAGTYTVLVTDSSGCTSTGTDTIRLINNVITLPFTDSAQVCSVPGSAKVWPVGGSAPYSYSWSTSPPQYTQSAHNISAGTYSVLVTDQYGCFALDSVTVGYVSLMFTVSGTTVNCNSPQQLLAVANDPSATFSWSPSAGLSDTTIANPLVTTMVNQTYTVTATAPCTSVTNIVTVTVSGTNPNTENICTVTVDTALNKNKIIWQRSNPMIGGLYSVYKETSVPGVYSLIESQPLVSFTSFTDTSSHPSLSASRYQLTTTDSCGTESAFSPHHRTIFLTVTPGTGIHCDLSWNAYEGFTGTRYLIYRGTTPHNLAVIDSVGWNSTVYVDSVHPSGTLYYLVTAPDPGSCSPSRSSMYPSSLSNICAIQAPNGTAEAVLDENSFNVYPNPSAGKINVDLELREKGDLLLEIYNGLGQVLVSQKAVLSGRYFHKEMNIEVLPKGIYFLEVSTRTTAIRHKLVKE